MSREGYPLTKTFTLDGANATLPLVRAITQDLVHLAQDVAERRKRVEALLAGRKTRERDLYAEELSHVRAELAKDEDRVGEYVDELLALGVEVQDREAGLIDFPAFLTGRRVYLCWKLGEAEILYWHELDDHATTRRPLDLSQAASLAHNGDFFRD